MEKYYQEDLYLNGDRKSLEKIEYLKKDRKDAIELENIKYPETIKKYQEYLTLVANLLKELELSTSIEYSLAISYLISRGYLSEDLLFITKNTNIELTSSLGISILAGAGCCRNISNIHRELMNRLNIPTKSLYCTRDLFLFKGKNFPADHVMSLIKYHKTLYGIDLMNGNQLYHFTSPFSLEEISLKNNRKYRYKPYSEMIMEDLDLKRIKKVIKQYEKESEKSWISSMEYEDEIVYPTKIYLNNQEEKFYGFHQKTKELKKEIAKELRKVSNNGNIR